VSSAEAARILGTPATVTPTNPDPHGNSACSWHVSVPSADGVSTFSVFLYRSPGSVQSFRSSLSAPAASVQRITVDGEPALWRPAAGPGGGTTFISASRHGALVTVEASGTTSSVDAVAKIVMSTALHALRSGVPR
jgi:hypothetical protein